MNTNILVVDLSNLRVYDFLQKGETEQELLKRANDYKQESVESWDKNRKQYPCKEYEDYYKKAIKSDYKVVTWNEYQQLEKQKYIDESPLIETTKEKYNEMLDVLPPLKWCNIDNVEMFCMREMYTGTYTDQYAKYGDKYYSKMVDITDRSTWINNYIKEAIQ